MMVEIAVDLMLIHNTAQYVNALKEEIRHHTIPHTEDLQLVEAVLTF